MSTVSWYYHRKNCNSCSKAAAFLADHQVTIKEQIDARKVPIDEDEVLSLLEKSDELFVTRGTKIFRFDLKHERLDHDELLELLIGRSGKLRAPAIVVGRTLVVGFDEPTYAEVFA